MAGFSFEVPSALFSADLHPGVRLQHPLGDGARRDVLPVAQIDLQQTACDRLANGRIGDDLAVDAKRGLAADASGGEGRKSLPDERLSLIVTTALPVRGSFAARASVTVSMRAFAAATEVKAKLMAVAQNRRRNSCIIPSIIAPRVLTAAAQCRKCARSPRGFATGH